ncbi:MAG: SGNH/GDSL hydrolase family protein [bacterium]|jgi:lysophospholipase L1-like esterase
MRLRLIAIVILFSACKKEQQPASGSLLSGYQGTSTPINSFLALGDSYTIGEAVFETERFATQTTILLGQMGVVMLRPTYVASTGWTTGHLRLGIDYARPERHTIVTLLIGVNDQYLGTDLESYRKNLDELMNKAIELAFGKSRNVFVLSIPDYSATPRVQFTDTARTRSEIDAFNKVNKSLADFYGCKYLYITDLTREARYDRTLVSYDGLHPSGKEYEKWAKLLAPMIKDVLQ